jgi:oligopeptide/dipeptide ABC transporter ATP-binding protein
MLRTADLALEVKDLRTDFRTPSGWVPAVDGVSFTLRKGEVLALVGESGCGKSATALSMLRLIPPRNGRIAGGSVLYEGKDLLELDSEALQRIRGNEIAMIFQEPMTALNPVLTIGYQITEPLRIHQKLGPREAAARAVEMLRLVNVPDPERRLDAYPHQLSGGMRQRAMIAIALCCNPRILIADEPTTALDVTVQAQILELLTQIRDRLGTAIIMITHDLGVVAETAHRVVVMYAGRKIEEADVEDLFRNPRHPYTQGLLKALPRLAEDGSEPPRRLHMIEGTVPALGQLPPGCAFAPRCPAATAICRREAPPTVEIAPGHLAACWHADKAPTEGRTDA